MLVLFLLQPVLISFQPFELLFVCHWSALEECSCLSLAPGEVWVQTFRVALHTDYNGQCLQADKMAKQEITEMNQRAGFEAVERDSVYNRMEKVAV